MCDSKENLLVMDLLSVAYKLYDNIGTALELFKF